MARWAQKKMEAGSRSRRLTLFLGPFLSIAAVAGVASAAGGVADGPRLAYLDPGSGSFILQALVAMLAGAVVAINAYWTKIKSLLGFSKADKDDQDAPRTTGSDG
jgi:hypothetical protein